MKNINMKKLLIPAILLLIANQAFATDLQFTIQIKDHKFIPPILEVPAEQKFKLIIENLDETAAEFESHDLNKEKIIMGNRKSTLIITPLKTGEYNFFDDFHAKETFGKIVVK